MNRSIVISILALLLLATGAPAQNFGPWSAPVNMGPMINSPLTDCCLTVSKNGLSLFFRSGRDGLHNWLYVSKRLSVTEPWGLPEVVKDSNGGFFNDGIDMTCPLLSPDEHRMFFRTIRPGGCGAGDFWVSRRHNRRDDHGWETPVNLGCAPDGPNSNAGESMPTVFEDETGAEVLYFSSGRPGLGGGDIWESRMKPDGTFGPATVVAELSTPYGEVTAVRHDGLEAILYSGRPGGPYGWNIWTSTRASTADPWSPPVLEPVLSQYGAGGRTQISFDRRAFYSCLTRPDGFGGSDLYVATREKLIGPK